MIRRLLVATFLAGLALLAPAAANASAPVTPGAFCGNAEHGDVRQAANAHWYICGQDPSGRYRWLPTAAPSPSAQPTVTCTHDGYGKTCTSPAPSRNPGYGHPKPSSSAMGQLPVTSSDNGRMLAIALVAGILLVLSGTAAFLWGRTRRKARHQLPRRTVVQRPAAGA